jgi:hypothetical protein
MPSTYSKDEAVAFSEILATIRATVGPMQCPSAFLSGVALLLILKLVPSNINKL